MDTRTLGSELKRARAVKRLRQEDVAREVKADRRRVSDWEADLYHPDPTIRPDLSRVLGLSLRHINRLCVPPAAKFLGVADLFEPKKPEYLPTGEYPTAKRLLTFYRQDKATFNELWPELNARADRDEVRRFFNKVQTDAQNEARGWMRLLREPELEPARLAPQRCGFRILPVVHKDTYEVVGDCPVPCIVRREPQPGVIFPQCTVMTADGPRRPDAIVGVRVSKHMLWCCTEFDGNGHNSNGDFMRPTLLKMPVVRYTEAEVRSRSFARIYWQKVHEALCIS